MIVLIQEDTGNLLTVPMVQIVYRPTRSGIRLISPSQHILSGLGGSSGVDAQRCTWIRLQLVSGIEISKISI